MKAQFLKIAKVKDEKAFYKKYPTEAAFFKAHPEAKASIKKAQIGAYIGGDTDAGAELINFQDALDASEKQVFGSTESERQEAAYKQQMLEALKGKGGGGQSSGMDMGSLMKGLDTGAAEGGEGGGAGGLMDMIGGEGGGIGGGAGGGGFMEKLGGLFGGGGGGMRYGGDIPKAYGGTNVNNWWNNITTSPQTTGAPGGSNAPATQANANAIQTTGYPLGNQPAWGMQSLPSGVSSGQPAVGALTGGTQVSQNVDPFTQTNTSTVEEKGLASKLGDLKPLLGPVGDLIGGIDALKAEKEAAARAKQQRMLSDLQLTASATRPEMKERRYVRPEDVVNTGESFFPIYGVGTNVLARNGRFIKKAQDGTIETPQIDSAPTDWYEEGMDKDTYYGFKKLLDDAGYKSIPKPDTTNIKDMDAITEYQPDPNQMSDEDSAAFMEMYNRDEGKSTPTFDSNSARDNWVQKTGLPWSEAKRLGYTTGSAKDNIKLLNELKDPRFKKENLRTEAPKKSSQTRTPIQHRETPTKKLTPIKKSLTMQEYYKKMGLNWNPNSTNKPNAEFKQSTTSSYDREKEYKRQQAEHDDYLLAELPLYYMANPSKLIGDIKNYFNPGFTKEDETSEAFRKQVMANRYNKNISSKQRGANHRQIGYNLVPDAAINVATVLSATPYTTFEAMPIGIGQGAGPKAAGYVTQGAKQLKHAGSKMLGYRDGGMIGGNPTEIQNTYGNHRSIYDDLGFVPLIDESQQKSFRRGGYIPQAQSGWQNYMSTIGGGGSGFSGAGSGGTPWGAIGGFGSKAANTIQGGGNAGGQIGSTLGGSVGAIFGPAGQAIGSVVGTIAGNELDPYAGAIKRDNERTKKNVENIAYNKIAPAILSPYGANVRDGGSIPNYEDGGYMNPEYNPQVITMFGDHNAEDFADYAHKDQYRAGGHLKSYTDPSERGMEQYAMGGELKTHWGGYAETMSHNPYLPGSGETVMFRGKSHEEKSSNGETGIGITYGDNPVEVERGEPMVELEEGGEIDPKTGEAQKSGVVFGNLKIPDQFLDLLGDKNAKGKKFKNYVGRDLLKQEKKGTRLVEEGTAIANKKDVTPLELNVARAKIFAGNSMLMTAADRKINAAGIQNAINETAEEHGLVADDLARGKFKINKEATDEYARYGKKIFANGGTIDILEDLKEMLKNKGIDYKQTSGVRPGAKTKQGRNSRHSTGEAIDLVFPKLGKDSYNAMLNDPEIARFMLDNNLTAIDEYDEDNLKQTGGTGGHLHIGLDKGTSLSDKFRTQAQALYGAKTTAPVQQMQQLLHLTTAPATTTKQTTTRPEGTKELFRTEQEALDAGYIKDANGFYKIIPPEKLDPIEITTADAMDNIPIQSLDKTTGLYGGVTAEEFEEFKKKNQWYPKFKDNTFDQNNPEHVDDLAKAFNAKSEAMGSKARILPDRDGNGKTTKVGKQVVSANLNSTKKVQPAVGKRLEAVVEELPNTKTVPHKRSGLIDFANQALDYIRPSDQEPFDYGQAMAEISALTDQVEPVQAQLYKPEIGVPYDISYQDVLDENQADYNSLVKKTGYNPAVQSNFAANKYLANQKVLAEQFRANQAMKAGVYGENRNTLNQAKLTNLGILDKQYERQSEAISNTKAGRLAALTSLQDKVAKHALENKTLGVYENLYKYRYDSKGRAINMNGIFQPNIGTVGSTAGTQKQVPIYGPDGKTITSYQLVEMTPQEIALQESNNSGAIPSLATLPININLQSKTKNKSRNGSIVKAIKNL
jgi:hypothetical protein